MKNVGLILEGGANRGIFTAGVLDLFKRKGIYLPYVLSVSVGSCNAMDYVSGQFRRTYMWRLYSLLEKNISFSFCAILISIF